MKNENLIWDGKMEEITVKAEKLVDEMIKVYKDINDIPISAEAKQLVYRTVKRDLIVKFKEEASSALMEDSFLSFVRDNGNGIIVNEIMKKCRK